MPIATDRFESLAGEVLQVYEQAEQTMLERVSNRLARGIDQPGWTERKYAEIGSVNREMQRYMAGVSSGRRDVQESSLLAAYTEGQRAMMSDAKRFAVTTGIDRLTPNAVKVVNIMSELDGTMNAADRHILRRVSDEYASIVGRASALVATGTFTNRQAVQMELSAFADKGITAFVDRAGRTWEMSTYAEMATLTAIERATREGYFDTMRELGYDLAMISDHYGACPLCEAWQGVVISIDGKTPGYLTLSDAEAAGVFHPRCMHDLSIYHEGITQGARLTPQNVEHPNAGYTARSEQRYYERQERRWKREMAVAQTPERERYAQQKVAEYQKRIRDLREAYNASTPRSVDYLPRKYWREGGRTPKLSAAARKISAPKATTQTPPKLVKRFVVEIRANTKKMQAALSAADYERFVQQAQVSALAGLYTKYGDSCRSIRSVRGGGVYRPASDSVEFGLESREGMDRFTTLHHEMSHMFDAHLGRESTLTFREVDLINEACIIGSGSNPTIKVTASMSDKFLEAMRKDRETLRGILSDSKTLTAMKTGSLRNASAGVQDAMDGFFGTQKKGILPWGHGETYYNRAYNRRIVAFGNQKNLQDAYRRLGFDASNLTKTKALARDYETASELWANCGSALACGGEELAAFERFMPNTVKAMREILGGLDLG